MNPRQLFPDLRLFKKEIAERFLVVTRDIYRNHPVYTYRDAESESDILIYPSYADTDYDGKQPRIVTKVGSYNYHLMDTFNGNMSKEVWSKGAIAGYESSQIITVPITLLIQAYAEEESSDIADELASLIVYACKKMYSGAGLVVRGVQVSETDIFNREQGVFQTSATVNMDVPWKTSMVDTGPPIDVIEFEPELPPLHFDTYRAPGVDVIKEKKRDI